jgi:formylmethanofuran dehydrogenase subunit A
MRPVSISAKAWDALWASFTAQVGTTWGDYVQMLDDNAAYLRRLDLRVVDVGQLLAFEFTQADGLTPLRTLASAVLQSSRLFAGCD